MKMVGNARNTRHKLRSIQVFSRQQNANNLVIENGQDLPCQTERNLKNKLMTALGLYDYIGQIFSWVRISLSLNIF